MNEWVNEQTHRVAANLGGIGDADGPRKRLIEVYDRDYAAGPRR